MKIYWDKDKNNLANYFTKHHAPAHHRLQGQKFILKGYHIKEIERKLFNSTTFWAWVYSSAR